jgi:hypothetical protein
MHHPGVVLNHPWEVAVGKLTVDSEEVDSEEVGS